MKKVILFSIAAIVIFSMAGCFLGAPKFRICNKGTEAPNAHFSTLTYKYKINDTEFDVSSLAGGTATDYEKIKPEDKDKWTIIQTVTVSGVVVANTTNIGHRKIKKGTKMEIILADPNVELNVVDLKPVF